MRASVIVPARDAQRTLPRTLEALARQERTAGHEVIVVDNGSRDQTARLAEQSPVVDRVIRRQRGEGPGAARNAGAMAAAGEVMAFLDADCWPSDTWLATGVAAVAGADLVQGRVLPDPQAPLGPFDRTLSVGAAHGLFESANLFVRRDLFDRIGGFPPGLESGEPGAARSGAPFGEDAIFGWSARRAGARTGFSAEAVVYHEVTLRGPVGYIAERRRWALFPPLAAAVPELRDAFFYRRFFHSRRSASFDLAAVGAAVALVADEPGALVAAFPYLWLLQASARRWGRGRAPLVALTELVGDAYGGLALLRGSIGSRSLVL